MRILTSIFHILFLLSLVIARIVFWTALGSLPIIYFFLEVDSIIMEIVITSIIVSFCYYQMMIWFKTNNNGRKI